MKRKYIRAMMIQCILICVVSIGGVSPTLAKSVHIGVGGGAYLPVGGTELSFDASPGIHGTIRFGGTETFALESRLGYWMLQNVEKIDTLKAVNVGLCWYMRPTIHVDTGIGAYNYTNFGTDGEDAEVSNYNTGVYGGIGVEQGAFDVNVRVHAPDFDGVYFGASLIYLFDIGQVFK